jgi:hypothetical protein
MSENETLEADMALVIAILVSVNAPQSRSDLLALVNAKDPSVSMKRLWAACKALTKQPICRTVPDPDTGRGYTHITLSWNPTIS